MRQTLRTGDLARFALVWLVLSACAPLPPGSGGAPSTGGYADERVHIGSFADIDGVAASRRFVYVAGSGGVAVFDRIGERWLPPAARDLARELGRDVAFGVPGLWSAQITAMTGDPVEDAVWIGVPGAVITYRPFTGQVQRTMVTGVPQRILFERTGAAAMGSGDALVQSGGQWTRVSRVGITTPLQSAPVAAQLVMPPTLNDLLARYPTLRAQPQMLLRAQMPNRPQRPFRLTAGAASPDRTSDLWLGTNGEGLFRVDPVFGEGRALPYGLIEPGAGALAAAANGVWVAGLGRSLVRGGLTFATSDLQQWHWTEGTITVPLAGVRSFALATRGSTAWLGTDRGLVRITLDGAQEMTRYTRLGGLPDDRVFAVAPRDDGTWAGTARGLVFVSDSSGASEPLLRDLGVYALQITGSTLWVGTQRGLVTLPANATGARAVGDAPREVPGSDRALRAVVRGLASTDTVLLVATDEAVLHFDWRTADGSRRAERIPALEPRFVGEITRAAADERTFAVAGRDGVVLLSRRTGARRELRVPDDVPGPVLDVLLQGDLLFLATPQGLLRYRRTGDGLVP